MSKISANHKDYADFEIYEMLEEIVNNYADGELFSWITDKTFINGMYNHYINNDIDKKPFTENQRQAIVNIYTKTNKEPT